MCKGKRGLGIHVGRMHRDIKEEDTKKRKFGDENKTVHFETQKDYCDVCGLICSSKTDLNQHIAQCIAQRDEFYKAQNETKIIQTKFQNICEGQVSKPQRFTVSKLQIHLKVSMFRSFKYLEVSKFRSFKFGSLQCPW